MKSRKVLDPVEIVSALFKRALIARKLMKFFWNIVHKSKILEDLMDSVAVIICQEKEILWDVENKNEFVWEVVEGTWQLMKAEGHQFYYKCLSLYSVVMSLYLKSSFQIDSLFRTSKTFDIKVGIHQGSSLGPLLSIAVMEEATKLARGDILWE